MNTSKEEKIDRYFEKIIGQLTHKEFWEWVGSWKDESAIMEDSENWDTKTKEEDIKKLIKKYPRLKKVIK